MGEWEGTVEDMEMMGEKSSGNKSKNKNAF